MTVSRPTKLKRNSIKLTFLTFTLTLIPALVNGSADAIKDDHFSFRGPLSEDHLHIPNFDISGTTNRILTAKDYLRLFTPFPLAYGGIFTHKPIPFEQWSVEIAFRIHGGPSATYIHENHSTTHVRGKGGRGLAFWYTKTANPTPITIPSDPSVKPAPAPLLAVDPYPDPLDRSVSFFGGPTSFDGLGVVFDTQPFSPVTLRSDRKHWASNESGYGADEWGIVSGVMDDGQGHTRWVEDKRRSEFDEDGEAEYLNHVIGDCQVGLRNAAGLIWAKITHLQGTISVHLDLSPHTTLSSHERHYKRQCFVADNVKLPKGYYVGLTGLASPNEEPDNIDVYAIEVKEIKGHADSQADVVEHDKDKHVPVEEVQLEGTGGLTDESARTYEVINAQREWAEAMKKLTSRLDRFPDTKPPTSGGQSDSASDNTPHSDNKLFLLEKKIDTLLQKLPVFTHDQNPLDHPSVDKLMKKLDELEQRVTDQENFLSIQIEGLRHLILHPPSASWKDDDHFKPLTTQHDDPYAPPGGYEHPPGYLPPPPSPPPPPPSADYSRKPDITPPAPHQSESSWWTVTKYLIAMVAVLVLVGGIYNWRRIKSKRYRYADEGSFTNVHGSRGTGLSVAMDTIGPVIGFRQRSKKMI
ncbi:hypothetical protein CROQUDRAFT_723112 [Cronartium quercuum f. sp. fusiforme G11]|uniref:L-type lectin-like domain-containing protein n=1 Tax=Cronartium quercuum f. sp. fusiforme G11 TaxID=708437 RepID=A0A9P6TBT6_9BASI|nr:hypothetical protein CROQUDRAFT_723112 [Cronartium quercuum f. sp. fusiforme G11]